MAADDMRPAKTTSAHGGRRPRAGRPPKAEGEHTGHRARVAVSSRHPVHVRLAMVTGIQLRRGNGQAALRAACAEGKGRFELRLVCVKVIGSELHFLVEAKDRDALTHGMQGLAVRIARAVNKALGRTGKLFVARYQACSLRTAEQTRAAVELVASEGHVVAPPANRRLRAAWPHA